MNTYYVTYRVDARYTAEVQADNLEDALELAGIVFSDANFGDAQDIDGEQITVEDESGNYIWER